MGEHSTFLHIKVSDGELTAFDHPTARSGPEACHSPRAQGSEVRRGSPSSTDPRLIYDGRALEDDDTPGKCGMESGDAVWCMMDFGECWGAFVAEAETICIHSPERMMVQCSQRLAPGRLLYVLFLPLVFTSPCLKQRNTRTINAMQPQSSFRQCFMTLLDPPAAQTCVLVMIDRCLVPTCGKACRISDSTFASQSAAVFACMRVRYRCISVYSSNRRAEHSARGSCSVLGRLGALPCP